jgi:hypothetical protein
MLKLTKKEHIQLVRDDELKEELYALMQLFSITDTETFEEYFGGNTYIVEKEDDLKDISTYLTTEDDSRFLNLHEIAASFDVAEYLPSMNWIHIFSVTNNAGGPAYYIPKEVFNKNRNAQDSIIITHFGEIKVNSVTTYLKDRQNSF